MHFDIEHNVQCPKDHVEIPLYLLDEEIKIQVEELDEEADVVYYNQTEEQTDSFYLYNGWPSVNHYTRIVVISD